MASPPRPIAIADIAALTSVIGSAGFGLALATFMRSRVAVDHVNCLLYSEGRGLECEFNAGSVPGRCADSLMRAYVEKYFRLDPNLERVIAPRQPCHHIVLPFDAERLPSSQYRAVFWKNSPFADKCSLIFFEDGLGFYCNFYRATGSPAFTAAERMDVHALGDFLTGLIKAHCRVAATGGGAELVPCAPDRLDLASPIEVRPLSERESVIMKLLLAGLSSEAISLDQNISLNTVKTYRKRLYRKLNVSTLSELHARFARSGPVPTAAH